MALHTPREVKAWVMQPCFDMQDELCRLLVDAVCDGSMVRMLAVLDSVDPAKALQNGAPSEGRLAQKPLHVAARLGRCAMACVMVRDYDFDPSLPYRRATSPSQLALLWGHPELAHALVELGGDLTLARALPRLLELAWTDAERADILEVCFIFY